MWLKCNPVFIYLSGLCVTGFRLGQVVLTLVPLAHSGHLILFTFQGGNVPDPVIKSFCELCKQRAVWVSCLVSAGPGCFLLPLRWKGKKLFSSHSTESPCGRDELKATESLTFV